MKIGVIGSGSWGSALVKILTDNEHQVIWCVRSEKLAEHIRTRHHNPKYLSSVYFDNKALSITTSPEAVYAQAEAVVIAVPSAYAEDYIENKGRYPEYYNGKLFIYDWMRGWIMAVTMADNGDFERMEPFLPSFEFNNLTDMLFSPEGDIYLLEYGTAWFSENPDSRLVHLKYNSGNRAPVANFKSDRGYGKLPLTIHDFKLIF